MNNIVVSPYVDGVTHVPVPRLVIWHKVGDQWQAVCTIRDFGLANLAGGCIELDPRTTMVEELWS